MVHRQSIGKLGEDIALTYLQSRGNVLKDRNVHFREGELDLVVLDGRILVCVEVKARTSRTFGYPEESLTQEKIRRVRHAFHRYRHRIQWKGAWRIDCLAIELHMQNRRASLRHIINI